LLVKYNPLEERGYMEREDVLQKVTEIIRQVMMAKTLVIAPEHNLKDDLGMDSLGAVDFVNAVEDAYVISVTEDEMKLIQTVNDAIDLILQKTNHG
jgi:acyl carrier protein